MKKKLFTIFFALVLVLSFSLMTAVPAGAVDPGTTTTLTVPENVYRPAEFVASGTTTNSGATYALVRFNITVSGPESFAGYDRANVFTITEADPWTGVTRAEAGASVSSTFVHDGDNFVGYWGPPGGFPLSDSYDATSTFTVEMCDVTTAPLGDYDLTVELVDLSGSTTLATATDSFTLSADTLYIGTGDEQFTSIQDAITAASPDDTITVAAGTYGPFTVGAKTNLTIQAVGAVIVEGAQSVATAYTNRDCVVFVNDSTNIVLDGLDIQGLNLGTTNPKNYGVVYENSSGEINDCTVSPNTIRDMLSIAIGIWDGSEVTVDTCTIHNFGRVGMLIYNACTVEVLGSTIIGQVYSGEGEVCYGIEVEGLDVDPATASHATITGNEIYNCDNTFYEAPTWQSGGVYINGWLEYSPEADSTVIVENNDIHDNYSGIIVIKSSLSYAHFNDIYDNRAFGVESIPAHDNSTAVFNATENWWGAANGPSPQGDGDEVSTNVDFTPWLNAEGGEPTYPAYNPRTGLGYDTIQDAVNAASPGDTITVGPGTYTGNITVSANITMVSTGGAGATKLTGTGGNPVVTIGDYTVVLDGFDIDPGTDGVYIGDDISAGNVVTIEDSNIHGNVAKGINVDCTVYGTLNILNNTISLNGEEGISINAVDSGGTVSILNNNILNNSGGIVFASVVAGSSVDVNYNSIVDNVCGIDNAGLGTVDATCNWWGDIAGPYTDYKMPLHNPCDGWTTGSSVSDYVDYLQWAIRIDLVKGWNIFSWPIAVEGDEGDPPEELESIFYFNSSTQFWGTPGDENWEEDCTPLDAMYIKATEPISGLDCVSSDATFPSQKEMKVGWNLIGLAALYPALPLDEALLDVYYGTGEAFLVGYSKVISPSLNGWAWDELRNSGNPHPLFPTEGYWVFMVNDGTLGGFTETPIAEVVGGP